MNHLFQFILCLMLLGTNAHSQTTETQAKNLRRFYNNQQADSIYHMTDTAFRKNVTEPAFIKLMKTQLFPNGNMVGFGFISTNANGVDAYKATTQQGLILKLSLRTNTQGQLDFLSFTPWKEEVTEKRNNLWHDNALATPQDSMIQRIALAYLAENKTPGISLAVLKTNKVFYYNYGWAREQTAQHPTPQTLYEIGSISKTFTAYLLANAVVANKVKLDATITQFLPDSVAANPALKGITLQMLSNHTSGLDRLPSNYLENANDINDPYAAYGENELFKYLKTAKTKTIPGTKYAYSNLAVGLLAVILERVNKMPYEQQLQQVIFTPLKMKSSFSTSITDSSMAAAAHTSNGNVTNYWNFKTMAGAGSIKSNATDMAYYALAFAMRPKNAKGQIDASVSLLEKITYKNDPTFVSLGWHFDKETSPNRVMEHNGATGGFTSYLGVCPDKQLAVVVLCNSAAEPGAAAVGKPIMNRMIGQ